MDIVKNFDDLYRISNKWDPLFTKVNDIKSASEHINFPHEDYPNFIEQTITALEDTISWLKDSPLTESDIRDIHRICMDGKEYIRLGDYRMGDVIVGGELTPPQPYLIPQMLMSIFPVSHKSHPNNESIINWYKLFETIHPFEDGNGRTGGIVLAAISYLNSGKYIVPKREYHWFLNPIIDRISNGDDTLLNSSRYFDQKLEFDIRCIQYISGKLNGVKFQKILNETGYMMVIKYLIKEGEIEEIKKLLTKISEL